MAKIVFTFRGNIGPADVADLQARVEKSVRALGLPEACEVLARYNKDGSGQVEVTRVPSDFEEQTRATVSAEIVASHDAVIQEE